MGCDLAPPFPTSGRGGLDRGPAAPQRLSHRALVAGRVCPGQLVGRGGWGAGGLPAGIWRAEDYGDRAWIVCELLPFGHPWRAGQTPVGWRREVGCCMGHGGWGVGGGMGPWEPSCQRSDPLPGHVRVALGLVTGPGHLSCSFSREALGPSWCPCSTWQGNDLPGQGE